MQRTCMMLDLAKLEVRLSRELGRQFGPADVHAWLNTRGIVSDGGGWWTTTQADLSQLHADEIRSLKLHVKDGPVTYVEEPPKSADCRSVVTGYDALPNSTDSTRPAQGSAPRIAGGRSAQSHSGQR